MGMPITTYTMLRALANRPSASSPEVTAAKAALDPFRLFAFVLHDPETHREFHYALGEQFDRLDYLTGQKLLFFALVRPPQDWLRHARNRPYYRDLGWGTEQFVNSAPEPRDSGITAFSLAHSLGIPPEDVPCIVLVPEFTLSDFAWVKTCPKYLVEQMTRLGYLADRSTPGGLLDRQRLQQAIAAAQIDLCGGTGAFSLEQTLAQALSELLSFVVAGSRQETMDRRQGISQALQILRTQFDQLRQQKSLGDPEQSEVVDDLCLKISYALATLNKSHTGEPRLLSAIDPKFVEPESWQLLKTAQKVADMLSFEHQRREPFLRLPIEDYTPAVICLAKVFERELNFSLVHWLRKEKGIELPPFFNRYEEGKNATIGNVNLNREEDGRWLPPAMGQSKFAARQWAENNPIPPNWTRDQWDGLMTQWDVIHEMRNAAAHTEVVPLPAVQSMHTALENLSHESIFAKFYQMKQEYRGA